MSFKRVRQGWQILTGISRRTDRANLSLVAAGGAFFAMLSVFPGLAAVITLLGFFADPTLVQEQMALLREFMPPDAYEIIHTQVQRMVALNSSTLGWATVISTLTALWSARQGTDALIKGLNAIYYGPSRRGIFAMALSFGLTLGLSLMAVVAILALVIVPLAATILNLPVFAVVLPDVLLSWVNGAILFIGRWVIALGVVFLGVWMLYRFAPNVKRSRTAVFSLGAILSILVWAGATFGFTYYLSNFANYSQVYGSIGAVVALLMFLYITIYVVMLGAALNAELEHRDALRAEAEAEAAEDIEAQITARDDAQSAAPALVMTETALEQTG